MTKIKMCGLRRKCDIEWAGELSADYIGFVFAKKSKRYVSPEEAAELKKSLKEGIKAVGVFVDEDPAEIARLGKEGIIDVAQLHGSEDEDYIKNLRELSDMPIIKAIKVGSREDIEKAEKSSADMILLDSGAGSGKTFDWELLKGIKRPYFLAGGLDPENLPEVIENIKPYGVDASSALETDGFKDRDKMAAFANAARGKEY